MLRSWKNMYDKSQWKDMMKKKRKNGKAKIRKDTHKKKKISGRTIKVWIPKAPPPSHLTLVVHSKIILQFLSITWEWYKMVKKLITKFQSF